MKKDCTRPPKAGTHHIDGTEDLVDMEEDESGNVDA